MSESKRQIVIVSAVSVLIALSLGLGIYFTQPQSISNSQSTTTVTQNLAFSFSDNPTQSNCPGYPSSNNSSVSAVPVPGGKFTPTPLPVWRYVSGGNDLTNIQVAVVVLAPGSVGHLCVAYQIGKFVGDQPNPNVVSLNPVAYNATDYSGAAVSQSMVQISAHPNLVNFEANTGGYLYVDYAIAANKTGFYYYSLPWAEDCRILPLSVTNSPNANLSTADFDQLVNNSAPSKTAFGGLPTVFCPGIPPPLGQGLIVSYYNLTIHYLTEQSGIPGVTTSESGSASTTVVSSYTTVSEQSTSSASDTNSTTVISKSASG
ncbi:MAG: hypothetical protein ACHQ1H_10610 [Nitrososphaerales archaeon]